jgi:hypothetical protein
MRRGEEYPADGGDPERPSGPEAIRQRSGGDLEESVTEEKGAEYPAHRGLRQSELLHDERSGGREIHAA